MEFGLRYNFIFQVDQVTFLTSFCAVIGIDVTKDANIFEGQNIFCSIDKFLDDVMKIRVALGPLFLVYIFLKKNQPR